MSDERTWNLSDEESTQNRETLDAAIASLYVAFRHRSLSPGGPDVCTGCCMPLDAKQRVATTPKQAISFEDLHEFQSAAKGEGAGQDMAYLLPRTMESVAAGREQGVGLFSLFSNYFPPVWPTLRPDEKEAVRNFYTALTRWRLGLREDVDCEFGIAEIIEMCGSGGFDVEPVFSVIAKPPQTRTAALAISDLLAIQSDLWQNGKRASYGLCPDRAETIANLLSAALSTTHVLSLLEAAVLQDEELVNLASLAHSLAESIMVERAGDRTTHP